MTKEERIKELEEKVAAAWRVGLETYNDRCNAIEADDDAWLDHAKLEKELKEAQDGE